MLLARDHSTHRTDNSRASEQPNQQRRTRHRGSWISQVQLAQWRVGRTSSNFPNCELDRRIQLAIGRVGSTKSNSPLGELEDPFPTRPIASWISLYQFAISRVGSVQCYVFSSSELPPSGLGQTVYCFVSIGVTVETLQ